MCIRENVFYFYFIFLLFVYLIFWASKHAPAFSVSVCVLRA